MPRFEISPHDFDSDLAVGGVVPIRSKNSPGPPPKRTRKAAATAIERRRSKIRALQRPVSDDGQALLDEKVTKGAGQVIPPRSEWLYGVSILTPNIARRIFAICYGDPSSRQAISRFNRIVRGHERELGLNESERDVTLGQASPLTDNARKLHYVSAEIPREEGGDALAQEYATLLTDLIPDEQTTLRDSYFKEWRPHLTLFPVGSYEEAQLISSQFNSNNVIRGISLQLQAPVSSLTSLATGA